MPQPQRECWKESEAELFRLLVENVKDYAIFVIDPQGRVQSWNPGAERLLGYREDEIIGKSVEVFFTPEDIASGVPQQEMREALELGRGSDDRWHVRKDGSRFWSGGMLTALWDEGRKLRGFAKIMRDRTEWKRAEQARQGSEARQAAILETALDAIITIDHRGRVVEFNPAAESLFGFARADVQGRDIGELIVPPRLREAHHLGMAHYLSTGEGPVLGKRIEMPALRADGTEITVELAITRIPIDGPPLFTAYLRDISEKTRIERYRSARLAVAQVLAQAANVSEAATGFLRAVCENLGWDVGFFWTLGPSADALHCLESWHTPGVTTTKFEAASRQRSFRRGEGLPGHTWATGKPAWLLDVVKATSFPRAASAAEEGLHGAFACPLVVGSETLGVIEFFSQRIREPDPDLLETMATLTGLIGQFVERKQTEDALLQSEQRFRALMEQAPFSIQVFSPDGRTIRVNRVWEELWGVRLEQIEGYNILEDRQLEARGVLHYIHQGFAGQAARIPAIQYNPNETIPDITQEADPRRWLSAVIYPLKDDAGRVREVVLIHEDITARKRAEDALRESEEKLRLLANTIPQLAWMARPDGHIFWYNRRWYEYTGTTPEQMEGWGWQSVHDPEMLPKVLERWKGSIASGEPFDMVFPLKGADDQFRPFLTRVNPLRDDRGRILYWFGTNTDISDIKGMEEALRQSEQRFRQLADAMPQIVWTARPDGNIDYLNRRWTEFTGLPDTVGNEGWGHILHPDEAQPASERWAASVQSGAPFEMEMRLLDRRQQTYRWHLIRAVAVHDEAGKVVRWFGASTDIHEQKRAEESSRYLAEASAALASVLDYESTLQKIVRLAVPYFADWSTVDVVDGSALRRLAVAHKDPQKIALVHKLAQDYPPDPNSPVGALAVFRTGKPELIGEIADELLVRSAQDERHLNLIRSLGLKSYICVPLVVSGKVLGVLTFATAESGRRYSESDLALATDLANRAAVAVENTQLYQALRDTDRRKDEFLATLAHELRNPLAPIRNALQILNMPRVDTEMAQRSRDMMARQVDHLVRLVDDLLDVSRVMRGKIELRKERIELASVVARAVETVQPLVDAQVHELSVRLPSESLPIDGDPVRLAQVVGNLLTNAAKYMEAGGRILLTADRERDVVVLRVRDTGIGIAPDMLPRIFELFVQVDHASTKAQGGLGIGLTLVKNLVEMHNGTVEARSEGLGKGSEFVVRLPLSTQALDQDHGRGAGQHYPQPPSPSGYRLLVVDDNQDAANSLAMLLKLQGHEVRVAFSGMAALEMTKSYTPDVVFLDIGMPGMDGYEVARQMRQQPGLEKVVLAALTGWGQQEDRRRTTEAGFNHHLVKPPEPKVVENVLAELKPREPHEHGG